MRLTENLSSRAKRLTGFLMVLTLLGFADVYKRQRYHRGSTPKSKHLEFMALTPFQREVVRKLSAILRIADGLDRRHLGVVSDVKVKLQGKKLQIDALASTACEIETWCAERNASMFESIFDVSIKVRGPQEKTLATEVQKAAIRI